MSDIFRYTDENDKSLGVAGMSIALLVCDGTDCIASVSVDQSEPSIKFTPETFFPYNPRISAKIMWKQTIKEFHLISDVIIGNVICRRSVCNDPVDGITLRSLHDLIAEQGHECQLEDDEIEHIFNNDIKYFQQLFSHPLVSDVARELARKLCVQRRMTSGDVIESLSRLSGLL